CISTPSLHAALPICFRVTKITSAPLLRSHPCAPGVGTLRTRLSAVSFPRPASGTARPAGERGVPIEYDPAILRHGGVHRPRDVRSEEHTSELQSREN